MHYNNLSNKQKKELKKQKEEQKNRDFNDYKKKLNDDYLDLHEADYSDFYDYILEIMDKINLPNKNDSDFYNKFKDFVIYNSSHKEIFIENEIIKYLDEISEEDNEEENDRDYDFMNQKENN